MQGTVTYGDILSFDGLMPPSAADQIARILNNPEMSSQAKAGLIMAVLVSLHTGQGLSGDDWESSEVDLAAFSKDDLRLILSASVLMKHPIWKRLGRV
jgi:hypothetical protein